MRCVRPGVLCAALLSFTGEARAAVSLEYSHDGRCPDEQAFKDVVAARMGFDPFEPSASARLVVTLAFRPPNAYEGQAKLHDGEEVQWVEPIGPAPNCTSIVRALGLAVAVRLRESREEADTPSAAPVEAPAPAPERAPVPVLASERTPVPVVTAKPAASPSVRQEADRRWRLGLDGGLAIASVPGEVAAEVAATGGYMLPPFSFWAEFRFTTPGTDAYTRGFRVLGGLVPCVHWRIGASPEFFTCVVAQGGAVFGSGRAPPLAKPESAVLRYVGLGPRLGIEVPIIASRLAVRGGGDVMFALVRPVFLVDRRPEWTASIVSGVVAAGLVLSL